MKTEDENTDIEYAAAPVPTVCVVDTRTLWERIEDAQNDAEQLGRFAAWAREEFKKHEPHKATLRAQAKRIRQLEEELARRPLPAPQPGGGGEAEGAIPAPIHYREKMERLAARLVVPYEVAKAQTDTILKGGETCAPLETKNPTSKLPKTDAQAVVEMLTSASAGNPGASNAEESTSNPSLHPQDDDDYFSHASREADARSEFFDRFSDGLKELRVLHCADPATMERINTLERAFNKFFDIK